MANLSNKVKRGVAKRERVEKCRDFFVCMRCVILHARAFTNSNKEEKNPCPLRKYNPSRKRVTSNQIYLGFTQSQSHFNIIDHTPP